MRSDVSLSQSEEALQATRLVMPRSPSSTAFLYNKELVFTCSTGTSRGAPPDEKISFNLPGERWQRFVFDAQMLTHCVLSVHY